MKYPTVIDGAIGACACVSMCVSTCACICRGEKRSWSACWPPDDLSPPLPPLPPLDLVENPQTGNPQTEVRCVVLETGWCAAASAPIWQLADTVRKETLDMQAVAITKGVSAAGGATDLCRDNLRAAWPLLQQVGQSDRGLFLLSESVKSCTALQSADDLSSWAQGPFFMMAEGKRCWHVILFGL